MYWHDCSYILYGMLFSNSLKLVISLCLNLHCLDLVYFTKALLTVKFEVCVSKLLIKLTRQYLTNTITEM